MNKRIGLYRSCGKGRSVRSVSVFMLRRCGWGLGPESGRVGWCYVCVTCESGFFV